MASEKEIVEFDKSLSLYEHFVYGTILYLQSKGENLMLEIIHAQCVEFLLRNLVDIGEGNSITKTLPKLETFDETTQEWNLKSKVQILQEMRLNHKSKIKIKEILW